MSAITDTFLFAHALELRLLLTVTVLPATYALIQAVSFIASIVAKAGSNAATGAYSAAGAR